MKNELGICEQDDEGFNRWWARNHPWDWWAKELGGQPLATYERLLVSQLVRDAYDAGKDAVSPATEGSRG